MAGMRNPCKKKILFAWLLENQEATHKNKKKNRTKGGANSAPGVSGAGLVFYIGHLLVRALGLCNFPRLAKSKGVEPDLVDVRRGARI